MAKWVFGENGYLIFPGNYLSSEVKHTALWLQRKQERCAVGIKGTRHGGSIFGFYSI